MLFSLLIFFFFFFNDTATTEIYTLSLHDALPIPAVPGPWGGLPGDRRSGAAGRGAGVDRGQRDVRGGGVLLGHGRSRPGPAVGRGGRPRRGGDLGSGAPVVVPPVRRAVGDHDHLAAAR